MFNWLSLGPRSELREAFPNGVLNIFAEPWSVEDKAHVAGRDAHGIAGSIQFVQERKPFTLVT